MVFRDGKLRSDDWISDRWEAREVLETLPTLEEDEPEGTEVT